MKNLIIHVSHNDTDGVGCTILSKYCARLNCMDVAYYNVSYGALDSTVQEALTVLKRNPDRVKYFLITDLSVRPDSNVGRLVDAAYKEYPNITFALLDHHPGTYWANKYEWATVRECDDKGVKHCGTYLLHEFYKQEFNCCKNRLLCKFVDYVDLYDTWAWKTCMPGGKPLDAANDLNTLLLIKGVKKHMSDMIYTLTHRTHDIFSDEDLLLIKADKLRLRNYIEVKSRQMKKGRYSFQVIHRSTLSYIERYFKNLYSGDKSAYEKAMKPFAIFYERRFNIGIVYADSNISELGSTLAELNPDLDFICIVDMPNKIHLRSAKELEVPLGIIAADMGNGIGGGHAMAAAANIPPSVSQHILESLIYK